MKTQNLFFMLILISMAFSSISCTDEDDKVEIPQLVGKWIVKEPVLQDDFVTCYTFNADKTYEVYTGSPSLMWLSLFVVEAPRPTYPVSILTCLLLLVHSFRCLS